MIGRRLFSAVRKVRIVEVGPRDGLQNEQSAQLLPAAVKINFIKMLASAGLTTIEAGSFVSPKWVPQMANTGEVLDGLELTGIRLPVLVPNVKGLENALKHSPNEISVFTAASEGFCKKNINMSVEESLRKIEEVISRVNGTLPVRGYVSTIIGCPYDGKTDPKAVLDVASELLRLGCYEVSLGDTIGVGTAGDVRDLLRTLLAKLPAEKLAVHFHDTYGQSLANISVALDNGINVIDSAAAGLGGCPYAPGASGNVATEDVLYMLNGLGYDTGVDLDAVVKAGDFMVKALGHKNRSKVGTALLSKQSQCA